MSNGSKRNWMIALAVAPVLGLSGCRWGEGIDAWALSTDKSSDFRKAAWHLDGASHGLDEYGSISISTPLLVEPKTNNPFKFSLSRTPDDYFKSAQSNVEGAAARKFESVAALRAALQARADVTTLANIPVLASRAAAQDASFATGQQLRRQAADADFRADLAAIPSTDAPEVQLAKRQAAQAKHDRALADLNATAPSDLPASDSSKLPDFLSGDAPAAETGPIASSFADIGDLLPDNLSPQLRDRIAINVAAGDVATHGMFKLLSDPTNNGLEDQRLFFGAAMVNVDPGWRTKSNFLADVSVTAQYAWHPARYEVIKKRLKVLQSIVNAVPKGTQPDEDVQKEVDLLLEIIPVNKAPATSESNKTTTAPSLAETLSNNLMMMSQSLDAHVQIRRPAAEPKGQAAQTNEWAFTNIPAALQRRKQDSRPQVTAVSPMTDVQSLDLSDANRRRTETALQLSLALQAVGADAAGKVFASYAQQLQNDIRTRTAVPTVTGYANSEGVFGFRVGPQLRALEDPSLFDSAPANVLERQTFPVLLLFRSDSDAVGLRYIRSAAPNEQSDPSKWTLGVYEPELLLSQTPRWSWRKDYPTPVNRMTELDRADYALSVKYANEHLAEQQRRLATVAAVQPDVADGDAALNHQTEMLLQRTESISTQLLGSSGPVLFPVDSIAGKEDPAGVPTAALVTPATLNYKKVEASATQPANTVPTQPVQTLALIGTKLADVTIAQVSDGKVLQIADSPKRTDTVVHFLYTPDGKADSEVFVVKLGEKTLGYFYVKLNAISAEKPKTQSVTVTRTYDGANLKEEKFEATPTSETLLQSVIERGKSGSNSADVKVNIQTTNSSPTTAPAK